MNNLSWLIYAADVAGGVGNACGLVAALSAIACGVAILAWFLNDPSGNIYSWQNKELTIASRVAVRSFAEKITKLSAITLAAAILIAVISPSRSTVYAIAASEMGEKVIESPAVTKAMKALDAWLDRQIAGKDKSND